MKYRLTSTVTFAQPNQAACSRKIAEIISEFRLQVHQNVRFKEHVSRPEDTEVSSVLPVKSAPGKCHLLHIFANIIAYVTI